MFTWIVRQRSDEKMSIILMNILFGILDILIIAGILLGIRKHFKVVKWKRNIWKKNGEN